MSTWTRRMPHVAELPNGAIARNIDTRYRFEYDRRIDYSAGGTKVMFPRDPRFSNIIKKYGVKWDSNAYAWAFKDTRQQDAIQSAMKEYFGRDDIYVYDVLVDVDIMISEDISTKAAKFGYEPIYILDKFIIDGRNKDNSKKEYRTGDDVLDIDGPHIAVTDKGIMLPKGMTFRLRDVRLKVFEKWQSADKETEFKAKLIGDNGDIETLQREEEMLIQRLRQISKVLHNN